MGWLVQATDYRKWNEPPRPRLQRNGTIYLMARRTLLCQGVSRAVLLASAKTHKKLRPRKQRTYRRSSLRGDFAFPAGCPRRPCFSGRLVGSDQPLQGGEYKGFWLLFKLRPCYYCHVSMSEDKRVEKEDRDLIQSMASRDATALDAF